MAEEESKIEKTEKPQAPERSWGEAAVDVIGTIADNYAKTGKLLPSLVGGIPAALNTDSFQAQKNKYAHNNFLMEQARKEAQRADELHPLNVEAKRLANANQQAILGVNQMRLDNLYYNEGIQKAKTEALERFQMNPSYGLLNSEEKTAFDNSVQMQKLSEFVFFGNEFQNAYNSKDEKQMERLSRMAAKDGLSFTQNEKGEWILAGNNYKVVINDENRAAVGNFLAKNAAKEYAAILETSQKSTYARADRKLHAEYAKQLVNTSNDKSLASNLALVKKEIGAMPQSWKNTMLLRQIIDDAASSKLTDSEKMQEAQMAIMASPEAISLLEQEGFSYSMPPDALSLKDVMFYDQKTERHLNFNEMQDVLHERDEGRNYLDNLVKTKGQERLALEQEARRKQELHAIRLLNQGQNQRRNQSEETAPTDENKNKLPDWYKRNNAENYTDLSSEQQLQLGNIYERFKNSNSFLFKDLPSNPTEKDLDKLRLLDMSWQKLLKDEKLSPEKFPSPVKEEIDRLEDNKDHDEALKIRKRIAQIEKDNGYKIPKKNINIGHNPYDISQFSADSDKDVADEYSSLVGKVRKIEKKRKERNSKKR
jgi:hypothetical protein